MNLYRVARPLNTLRATLVVAMVALFAAMFVLPFGRDLFDLDTTEPWAYLVGAVAIAVAYPLLMLGAVIVQRLPGAGSSNERRPASAAANS